MTEQDYDDISVGDYISVGAGSGGGAPANRALQHPVKQLFTGL